MGMGIEGIGRDFEGLNISSKNKPFGEVPNKNGIDSFNTVQYTSKKDGKTYIAKKYTLKQGDKSVTGIFVAEKGTKPDKFGNINGQFMSFETFMKTLADEVPAVNSNLMSSYYPNINKTNIDESYPLEVDDSEAEALESELLTPDEIENKLKTLLDSGVHLQDGSVLLKEHKEGGAIHKISSNSDGTYNITSKPIAYGAKAKTQTVSELELITYPNLFDGSIKQIEDGKYKVVYRDKNGMLQDKEMLSYEVLNLLGDSGLVSVYKDGNR